MIDFKKYETVAAKLTSAANALWNKVTFITVAEILAKDVDLRELDRKCWDLKTINSNAVRSLSNDVNSVSEEEYSERYEALHNTTEDLLYVSAGKLNVIDSVISELRKIDDDAEEENFLDKFKDIQPINLHESIIRLERISIQ
jgi:hypothetical protein